MKRMLGLREGGTRTWPGCAIAPSPVITTRPRRKYRPAQRQPRESSLIMRQNLAQPPLRVHSNSLAASARQRFRLRLFPFCKRDFPDLMLEDEDSLLVANDDIG